ncbi:MAG: glycosyl hydrolase family 28-related protein [Luteolibacter sp.]
MAHLSCLGLVLGWLMIPNRVSAAVENTADSTNFNIRNYGAVGDGKQLDSAAINRAIDAAAAAGGGTVLVPAGTYLSGSIHLKSNIHLFLDAGSIILGAPQSLNAYDETEAFHGLGYQDGGHTYFHNSLIWGENLTHVSITGPGMINGGGLVLESKILDEMCQIAKTTPRPKRLDNDGKPIEGSENLAASTAQNFPPVRIGNKAIALKLCKNVIIRDVTIYHGGHFAILATGCDNLTLDNVTVDTNRDGIDLDCCRNTVVSNCRVNAPGDDAICPKSTYALGEIRITENLTIVNCQVSGFEEGTLLDGTMKPVKDATGRIKFGTEGSGGFRNVTVANCTFRNCRGLALEQVDGGILENFTITNLAMMDLNSYAIYITTGKRNRAPKVTTNSRIKNVLISQVIANVVGKISGIQIMGLPEQPIEGVRMENIRITSQGGGTKEEAARVPDELGIGYPEPYRLGVLPAYGVYARHVKNLELANITVTILEDDLRPAAKFSDIDGLEIDNFKAAKVPGVRVAEIAPDVRSATIRNSPALE